MAWGVKGPDVRDDAPKVPPSACAFVRAAAKAAADWDCAYEATENARAKDRQSSFSGRIGMFKIMFSMVLTFYFWLFTYGLWHLASHRAEGCMRWL